MATAKKHLFKVRDESGEIVDNALEGDLVTINLMHPWPSENPPPGIFKSIKEDGDDGSCVVLEVADRIGGYDERRLQTKLIQVRVESIEHIRILARKSGASYILFKKISTLLATTADLRTNIKKAVEALNSQ